MSDYHTVEVNGYEVSLYLPFHNISSPHEVTEAHVRDHIANNQDLVATLGKELEIDLKLPVPTGKETM